MTEKSDTPTGLTSEQAQEFHALFVQGFIGFTVVAFIAHVLVWMWRPWLPGEDGYAALMDGTTFASTLLSSIPV